MGFFLGGVVVRLSNCSRKCQSFNFSDLYEFAGVGCVGPGSGNLTARPHDRDALS